MKLKLSLFGLVLHTLWLGQVTLAQKTGASNTFGGGVPFNTAVYYLSDYASLAAAVTAIGSSNNADLVISTSTACSSSISKNIRLVFTQTGGLTVANGAICNINNAGWEADPNRQLFTFTGTGRVTLGDRDNTAGDKTAAQMVASATTLHSAPLFAAHWGIKADYNGSTGTDNATAISKLLAIIPSAAVVYWPKGAIYTTAEIAFNNRKLVHWKGFAPTGEYNTTQDSSTVFVYGGAAGGTQFHLGKVRDCLFESLVFDGGGLADKGIYLDNGTGTAGDISSANIFLDVDVSAKGTRSTYTAYFIGNAANGNNDEYHKIIRGHIRGGNQDNPNTGCTGTGVYLAHANVKQITIEATSISACAKAVLVMNGSFSATHNNVSYSNIGYHLESWSEPIQILHDDSEGLEQLLYVPSGGGSTPINISLGRYDRTSDYTNVGTVSKPFLDFGTTGNTLYLSNNTFGNWYHNSNATWAASHIYLVSSSSPSGGRLVWDTNATLNYNGLALYANFQTFGTVIKDSSVFTGNATDGSGGGIKITTSGGLLVDLAALQVNTVQVPDAATTCTPGTLCYGAGTIEVAGPFNPNTPTQTVVGTTGATARDFAIVAKDSAGNKTKASYPGRTTNAHATLDGTNYITLTWPASPNATEYDIIERNQADSAQYRLVASTAATTYNVQANPTGAYDYVRPTTNTAARTTLRGIATLGLDRTITAGGTTGAQTINKVSGCVNAAASSTSLVVTNSLVTTSSIIIPSVQTADATLLYARPVAGSGSFTLNYPAATAETKICFVVFN